MPRVSFTQNLQRHVPCPPIDVDGGTVREAIEAAFQQYDRLRGYVLDDQGTVRRHVVIFVNGAPIRDRRTQSDPVGPGDDVFVMQALSGG